MQNKSNHRDSGLAYDHCLYCSINDNILIFLLRLFALIIENQNDVLALDMWLLQFVRYVV